LIANNCIKLLLLTSEQNLCEMALVKNAARNGAVCYHHDSKDFFLLLCLFLPKGPTLYKNSTWFCIGYYQVLVAYCLRVWLKSRLRRRCIEEIAKSWACTLYCSGNPQSTAAVWLPPREWATTFQTRQGDGFQTSLAGDWMASSVLPRPVRGY